MVPARVIRPSRQLSQPTLLTATAGYVASGRLSVDADPILTTSHHLQNVELAKSSHFALRLIRVFQHRGMESPQILRQFLQRSQTFTSPTDPKKQNPHQFSRVGFFVWWPGLESNKVSQAPESDQSVRV